MSKEQHPEGLDDVQSLRHHEHARRIRFSGRIIVAMLLLAGMVGLFGSGVLSHAKAGKVGSAFWVEYDRFVHYQATTELRMHVQPSPGKGEVQIWIDREYAAGLEMTQISPQPHRVAVADDRLLYTFLIAEGRGPIAITFRFEGTQFGKRDARVGIVGGPEESLSQFFYP